jgi:hypothetical protein
MHKNGGKKPLDVFSQNIKAWTGFQQKKNITLQQKQHKTSTITIT